MKTRSRKSSDAATADEKVPTLVPIKNKKEKPQKQSTVALVASIISSIKDENSTEQNTSNEANGKPAAPKKVAPKQIRGIPKSGRPWKEPKKK